MKTKGGTRLPADTKIACRNNNRSEEHTSELQSRLHLVCRLLLEKKKTNHFSSSDAVSVFLTIPARPPSISSGNFETSKRFVRYATAPPSCRRSLCIRSAAALLIP